MIKETFDCGTEVEVVSQFCGVSAVKITNSKHRETHTIVEYDSRGNEKSIEQIELRFNCHTIPALIRILGAIQKQPKLKGVYSF